MMFRKRNNSNIKKVVLEEQQEEQQEHKNCNGGLLYHHQEQEEEHHDYMYNSKKTRKRNNSHEKDDEGEQQHDNRRRGGGGGREATTTTITLKKNKDKNPRPRGHAAGDAYDDSFGAWHREPAGGPRGAGSAGAAAAGGGGHDDRTADRGPHPHHGRRVLPPPAPQLLLLALAVASFFLLCGTTMMGGFCLTPPASSSASTTTSIGGGVGAPLTTCPRATGIPNSPCLPRLIIGGAMKCGTNEAMAILEKHPRAIFNFCPNPKDKQVCTPEAYQGAQYDSPTKGHVINIWEFNARDLLSGRKGILRYLNRLPKEADGHTSVTLEKCPTLLETAKHPLLPEITRTLMPGTKMVFTVCDPAERLVSEFFHYFRTDHRKNDDIRGWFLSDFTERGLTPPSNVAEFIDIVTLSSSQCIESKAACQIIKDMYFDKGLYHDRIKDWLKWYDPASEILVIHMNAAPAHNAARLLEFANFPLNEYPWKEANNSKSFHNVISGYAGRSAAWGKYPDAMGRLAALYSESNKALAALIGEDFPLQWRSTFLNNETTSLKEKN